MGYRRGILSAGLALTLAACGPSGVQSPEAVGGTTAGVHEPEILGVVKVEFQHIGQADFSVNATVVPSGVTSQTLARASAVTFTQGTQGSFTAPNGVRYLFGRLNVNNTGAARSNLTLLGISTNLGGGSHTLGDTSLAAATRLNGTSLTALEARKVLPINRRNLLDDDTVQVVESQADFQAYREADITPAIANYMAASPYNGYAFPFGFVARSKTNANTRVVPTGTAAGTVTLAFRYADANTTNSLGSFTWYGLITADNENRVTADAFEDNTLRACVAARTLYGDTAAVITATLRNVMPTSCGRTNTAAQFVSTVRTSGSPAAPTTSIPEQSIGGSVIAWGSDQYGQTDVPALPAGLTYTAVSGGFHHSLALRSDGQVIAWGSNNEHQTDVPALPAGLTYTAVAGIYLHSLALRSDGQVVAWGYNYCGQTNVPALPAGLTYTAVGGGDCYSLALRSDGQVVAWGNPSSGQTVVPTLPAGLRYTAVSAGAEFGLALRTDGQVVAWGNNNYGQTSVPVLPIGVTYTAVSAGHFHGLALRSDGQVVAWGLPDFGQTNVPTLPAGLTYTAVSGGYEHSLALRSDGQIVSWGLEFNGRTPVPALPTGQRYVTVSDGGFHSLAIAK